MVESQRSPQETAELTVQTQQEKISQAIEDIKIESNKNFNNINELINQKFFDNIGQKQAERIINIIDDLFKQWWYNKDLKDLREFLEPKAAKTISSFGQSNEYIPDTKIVLDLNGKSQLQIINAQISTLESSLWNNKKLKDIITELKNITNNLNERNKGQLVTFLTDNWISGISENTWNTELLQWVNLFLRNINKHLTDIDESNNILNERNENANRFNEFLQTINGWERKNLDKFNNKEDLQRLQTFIEQNPGNKDIMRVYLNMKGIQIKEQNNTHHQDRKVFENILNILENEYWENGKQHKEFQQYILDVKFDTRKIKEDNKWLMNLCTNWLKLNRNWNNINKGTPNIQNFCKSRWFNVDQFIKKFNGINQKRIDNNVQQLKDFNILSVISEGELKKFTIEEITEGNVTKPQLKYDNTVLSADWTNLLSTLWLEDKAKEQPKTDPWKTNFVNENELTQLINSSSDIQTARYEKIFNKVKEDQQTETPETPDQHTDNIPEELKELNANDIKNIRKYVDANKVATFFNKAIKTENLSDDQKEMLLLAQKWLVTKQWENDEIKELQSKLWFLENAIDWKFGIKTFNALKEKFGWTIGQPIEQTNWHKINKNGSILKEVTITANSIETEQNNLIKNFSLREKNLDDKKMNYFGINKNTKIFSRASYTWIYYFDNDNMLHYIPDLSQQNANHKSDKIALWMVYGYKNDRWTYENPRNTANYADFLKKGIDANMATFVNLKWDSWANTFCIQLTENKDKKEPNWIVLTQEILKMFDNPNDVLKCAYGKLRHNNDIYCSNNEMYWNNTEFVCYYPNNDRYKSFFKPSKIPSNTEAITNYFNDTKKKDLKTYW